MKYLLIGYLGANNLGDECMLRQFLTLFDAHPHVSFIIDSHGIDYTSERVSTHLIPADAVARRYEYDKLLKEVDGVIWVGGNCFTDFDGDGAVGLVVKARRMGKRFYYFGVGTDNLTLIKRKLRAFLALHLADAVIFRDHYSLHHAKGWLVNPNKMSIAPDLGELFLLRNAGNYPVETSAIVVSWRELKKNISNQDEVLQNLTLFLVTISATYDKPLVIFNTDEYADKDVHETIIALLTGRGFSNFVYHEDTSLEQKLTHISTAFCVITARLHTAVAADVFTKPTYVYNYSQKIVEFARGKENVSVISGSLAGLLCNDVQLKQKTASTSPEISDKVYRDFVVKHLVT
jgi:polysaccharide pyruvyl transferase WcaK-like protein